MRRNRKAMTSSNMEWATKMAFQQCQDIIKRAARIAEDADVVRRQQLQMCKGCYYITRMAGQAITHAECMSCGEDQMYTSTDTDVLCMPCAEETGLCKHCGGDIDMQTRRKDWPQPKVPK